MAKVSTDDAGKDKGQPEKVRENEIQEKGVTSGELKSLLGRIYGSNVQLVEEEVDGKNVAKVQVTSYGTGTFVIDGEGDSADEARTDLWNRIPRYPDNVAGGDQSLPHDYTRPNGV